MTNRCRFAPPMTLPAFSLVSRRGHDAHACVAGRIPRFPRNVRRLASHVPRTCCPLSIDPWGYAGGRCVETSAAARLSVPECEKRGARAIVARWPYARWDCGVVGIWRKWLLARREAQPSQRATG